MRVYTAVAMWFVGPSIAMAQEISLPTPSILFQKLCVNRISPLSDMELIAPADSQDPGNFPSALNISITWPSEHRDLLAHTRFDGLTCPPPQTSHFASTLCRL